MTTTDWRELCSELANDLQEARDAVADWAAYASEYFQQKHNLQGELDRINRRLDRARAALAQPEPEVVGPSDEELLNEWCKAVINLPGDSWSSTGLAFARAVLARWGRPAPATAGEVAELVRFLRDWGGEYADEGTEWHRAADLLERQAAPVPVAVFDRLPQLEDCDEDGRCWQWIPDINGHLPLGHWELQLLDWLSDPGGDATHWLPAHALPLPSGEVEA